MKLYNYPNRIIRMKSEIVREEAFLRKKLYDEIYFKKAERNHSPILISASNKKQPTSRY